MAQLGDSWALGGPDGGSLYTWLKGWPGGPRCLSSPVWCLVWDGRRAELGWCCGQDTSIHVVSAAWWAQTEQEGEAVHLLSVGVVLAHFISALLYQRSGSRAHLDSTGGDINPMFPRMECPGICGHLHLIMKNLKLKMCHNS